MREYHASPGSMCPAHACVGNWSSWSWHFCVARMTASLGIPTTVGGDPVLYGLCGELGCKKYPVAPVSATQVRVVVVGDWCNASLTSCPRFRLPTCTALMSQSLGLFNLFLFSVLVCVTSSRYPCSLPLYVILLCPMRTLNPWDQQCQLGSIGTYSLVIVALGGFWDSVPCVMDSRTFVATRDFTCAKSTVLLSINFCLCQRGRRLCCGRPLPLAPDYQVLLPHLWFHGQSGRY